MLEINIGPEKVDDFVLGKWLLFDGIYFFVFGIKIIHP